MFEEVVREPGAGWDDGLPDDCPPDDCPPDDNVDGELQRLLAGDELPEWVYDGTPPPTFGSCEPSGWLALDLDIGAGDPGRLGDAELIEAIVGFDRITSWAA